MLSRLLTPPTDTTFFLFGPRGTGKSTWVRARWPKSPVVDLLDEGTYAELAGRPSRLLALGRGGQEQPIIIDEVQRLPPLLDEVHRLIQDRGLRFVLTGSSARKLRRGAANLLAGRAYSLQMHPLTAVELGPHWDLARAVRYGHLPGAVFGEEPERFLKAYTGTYLREEILAESLVRNVSTFARFLETASFSQASVLNVSNVALDCGISRATVERHFELMEDLLLGVRVPPFTRRAGRRVVQHPKFFYFDAGVFRALRPRGPLDNDAEIDGAALETLVFQELRALNGALDLGYALHHWRSADGREVDFVLYGPRGFHAIEVKRTSRFQEADLRGLRAFRKDYPEATGHMLYGGDRAYSMDGIEVRPLSEALPTLREWI